MAERCAGGGGIGRIALDHLLEQRVRREGLGGFDENPQSMFHRASAGFARRLGDERVDRVIEAAASIVPQDREEVPFGSWISVNESWIGGSMRP